MKAWYSIFICCVMVHAMAQTDTVYLEEILVEANEFPYQLGDPPLTLSQKEDSYVGLSDLLQSRTPVYIRTYGGYGQLSTISFRGTTPAHTMVRWNNIDLNSQTLGQSDFSSFAWSAIKSARISQGPASALYGNGSLGGSIDLQTSQFDPFQLETSYEIGSFGRQGASINHSNKLDAWSYYVNLNRSTVDNDFKVNHRDRTYRQNNARSKLLSLSTGLKIDLSPKSQLLLDNWITEHDRQIQPIIGDRSGSDELRDRNFRHNLKYRHAFGNGIYEVNAYHIADFQRFNRATEFNIFRTGGSMSYEWFKGSFTLKTGSEIEHSNPDVENYDRGSIRNRMDIYLFSSFEQRRHHVVLNLRRSFVTGFNPPIAPSIGYEYQAINQKYLTLAGFTKGSLNYRTPTLNDLFWYPGGDVDLRPELGYSGELGIRSKYEKDNFSANWTVGHYRMRVRNLIQWIPGGTEPNVSGSFFYAENVRRVRIRGLESILNAVYEPIEQSAIELDVGYSYNQSINQTALDDFDRSRGKQLAYVPHHKATAGVRGLYRNVGIRTNYAFTGERYTEANNERALPAFSVFDLGLEYRAVRRDHLVIFAFIINNLADTEYQNFELRATPGRHYLLKINYQFYQ